MGWISHTGKVGLEWTRRGQLSQIPGGKAFQMMEIVPEKAKRKNGSGPQGAASKQPWLEQSQVGGRRGHRRWVLSSLHHYLFAGNHR